MSTLKHLKKVSDYHKLANLSAPEHPMISLIDYSNVDYQLGTEELKWKQDYYTIGLKRNIPYKFYYGQQEYDFDEGVMTFIAPNQVMNLANNPNVNETPKGWLLLFHPDLLWKTPLSVQIKAYQYFDYSIKEALFLSPKEEAMMVELFKNIEQESQTNLDQFSQKIIVSQLEVILNYAERFYKRQFITRKIDNHKTIGRLEQILNAYIASDSKIEDGLPSVTWVADQLNLSPNYLSSLLKSQTGLSTQQHIHHHWIEHAKIQLSTTPLSVSEIAYNLGFEHPTSFSKLFKNKTKMSPLEFRKSFN